jgi:endonuclease G
MKKRKKQTKKKAFAGFSGLLAFICVCCLYLYNYLAYPVEGHIKAETPEIGVEKKEIPKLQSSQKEQIIEHEGYTVSYNPDYKIANWVAYELTAQEAGSNEARRSDRFVPDPLVDERETATGDDYAHSGYDRGHLAPAGDMKWSDKAMQESFYYTNICPQDKGLNTGIWNSLEMQCRKWAGKHGTLLIVTGPVIKDNLERLGCNEVGIPQYFYKVVCIPGDKPKGIGFLFENRSYTKTPLRSMAVPIDSIEKISGIDFFYTFPIDVQARMEASLEWEY